MKSGTPSADKKIDTARIANNQLQADPMNQKKSYGIRPAPPEGENIESILDILDKEMANAGTNPANKDPANEMDLLVADLLDYLALDPIED